MKTIHGFLVKSHWAKGLDFSKIEKSVRDSPAFGLYLNEKQIGFARVITDYSRIAYLADVFVLEPHRGKGLPKWLMSSIMEHPELQELVKWILITSDAHGLYKKFTFKPSAKPETYMEIIESK